MPCRYLERQGIGMPDTGIMHQHTPLLVDIYAAAAATGIRPGTLRVRLHRGTLTRHGKDRAGRDLVDLNELQPTALAKAA